MKTIHLLALGFVLCLASCTTNQPCSYWTEQSSCVAYQDPATNLTCLWSGTDCGAPSEAVACSAYVSSSTCNAATDSRSGLQCNWNGSSCAQPAYCSHQACGQFTAQDTCIVPRINSAPACAWGADQYGVSQCTALSDSACSAYTTEPNCLAGSNFCTWNP